MAIQLKDLKQKKLGTITREIEHESGVSITIEFSGDKAFERAFSKVQEQMQSQKLTKNALSRANNTDDTLTGFEAQLFVVGEYLIKDWEGVETADGEKAKVSGENFVTLCSSISDDSDVIVGFVTQIMTTVGEVIDEYNKLASDAKKKQSKSGSGTKKTAS